MAKWRLKRTQTKEGNRQCLVFVHGFSGDVDGTWREFPDLVAQRLPQSDVLSYGYRSDLKPEAAWIWSAAPGIQTLADEFRAFWHVELDGYRRIVLLAHSLGGLVVQRALLDEAELPSRVERVFLFATPSAGILKAAPFRFPLLGILKRQVRDMARGGPFIRRLREDWKRTFGDRPPFELVTVAGSSDEFIPSDACHSPFLQEFRRTVPGDHLTLVKPQGEESEDDAGLGLVLREMAPTPEPHDSPPPPFSHPRTYGQFFHNAALSIDRTDQWLPIVEFCRSDQSGLLLVHGEERQNLGFFIARVEAFLNDESRHHRFVTVHLQKGYAKPGSTEAWENHLRAGLGPGEGTARDLLEEASRSSPVFLVLAGRPLGPDDLNLEQRQALADFLDDTLPRLLAQAARQHPIRALLALHYGEDTSLKDLLDRRTGQGASRHNLVYLPLPPLRTVTWDHIRVFVNTRPDPPPPAVVDALHRAFQELQENDFSFSELVELLSKNLYSD